MLSKISGTCFESYSSSLHIIPCSYRNIREIKCCSKDSPPSPSPSSSSENKFRFKLPHSKWKLNEVDTTAIQETLSHWLSKTQNILNEVTSPLVKNVQDRKPNSRIVLDAEDTEDTFMIEETVDNITLNGDLSVAAVVSIEQFSRMNGLTGLKMQKIFKALVSESIYSDARNLVEYCCFRFLSRDSSEIHPCLKEPAFRRLIFVTMLAWEKPYSRGNGPGDIRSERASLKRMSICEEAFVRIAPAVSGVADWSTAHNLFKALAGDKLGISYSTWSSYVIELLKVHDGRKLYQFQQGPQLSSERILCLGSSRKPPVLKWENNMAWPGKLTLTDKALYFEGVGLAGKKGAMRMDLTSLGSKVEKARVGPLGTDLFDSAISVVGEESKTWVLEFIDLGGEMRRDVWYAFVCEVISLYKFKQDFGPKDGDQSVMHVYGAQKGKARATTYAINGIARLQALQYMRKLLDDPIKLSPFSYLQSSPHGVLVCQTLAVNFWGGQRVTQLNERVLGHGMRTENGVLESRNDVFDIDGSVYLRRWMVSPSWNSNASVAFWRNSSVKQGIVLSKNLVVAGRNLVEKAASGYREKYREVEKLQATIDAAMIEGIPSNIDLFKELMLPLVIIGKKFEKLRHWEQPPLTVAFLAFAYVVIFRNLLAYIFPTTLMMLAAGMLLLKGLREQGRLGRYFGKITIYDQPPSNTIQKIIAVKEAMREVEKSLQNLNVSLLKIRTVLFAGAPQATIEVALVLLLGSATLLILPFKYVLGFFIFDLFTRELDFRREMVIRFMSLLKERWDAVPPAPVAVIPYEDNDAASSSQPTQLNDKNATPESRGGSKSR